MSAKHTAGPWSWDQGRHYLRAAEPDPSTSAVHTILDVGYGYSGYLGSDRASTHSEGEANFDLIAAAPLLFDALETLYDALTTGAGRDFLEAFCRDAGAALEAASPGWSQQQELTRAELRARAAA